MKIAWIDHRLWYPACCPGVERFQAKSKEKQNAKRSRNVS
jgi:hypothetical protein